MLAPYLLGLDFLDPQWLIEAFGDYALWGVLFIVFAECGLLIGFFLPGDSLLFTAGLLIAQDIIGTPLWLACAVITIAAVAGNLCGYWIGRTAGPSVFNRPDSRLFKQEYVDKTFGFFDRYGNRAIVLARFVPIVRTFTPIVAGIGEMRYRTFVTFNVLGGLLWAVGVTSLGHFLGEIEFIRDNIEYAIIVVVLVSLLPIAIEFYRARKHRHPGTPLAEAIQEVDDA